MYGQILKTRRKLVILFIIGLALSLFIRINLMSSSSMFFTDVFFVISVIYLFCGLYELVNNMGVFNSLKFGTKSLYSLIKSALGNSAAVKEDYLAYINSRPKYGDISILLIFGVFFLTISILCSVFSI